MRSPVAHGRIRGIDTSRAEQVPGVLAVATAADAPEVKFGPYTPDWEILARHKVRFVGDEVAAVAALTNRQHGMRRAWSRWISRIARGLRPVRGANRGQPGDLGRLRRQRVHLVHYRAR
ncbi:MAG: hypothetical protein HZY75_04825 [Nocardioidaceae bacterium]|nr:MAG: hypothetical protein HZY75_04825 [Nocardioidaceae bacterium]